VFANERGNIPHKQSVTTADDAKQTQALNTFFLLQSSTRGSTTTRKQRQLATVRKNSGQSRERTNWTLVSVSL